MLSISKSQEIIPCDTVPLIGLKIYRLPSNPVAGAKVQVALALEVNKRYEVSSSEPYFLGFGQQSHCEKWAMWIHITAMSFEASRKVFGGTLESGVKQREDGKQIPRFLEELVEHLSKHIGEPMLDTTDEDERLAKAIVAKVHEGESVEWGEVTPRIGICLLRSYFGELRSQLIPAYLIRDSYEAAKFLKKVPSIAKARTVFKRLPRISFSVLKFMVDFLERLYMQGGYSPNVVAASLVIVMFPPQTGYSKRARNLQGILLRRVISSVSECFSSRESVVLEGSIEPRESTQIAQCIHGFAATREEQISLEKGEDVFILERPNNKWWMVACIEDSRRGFFPAAFLREKGDQKTLQSQKLALAVTTTVDEERACNEKLFQKLEEFRDAEGKDATRTLSELMSEILKEISTQRVRLETAKRELPKPGTRRKT